MNFDNIVPLINPFGDRSSVLEASPANPSALGQDNSTTAQLRFILGNIYTSMRDSLLADVPALTQARQDAKIYFPDDDTFTKFCTEFSALSETLDNFKGIWFIPEADLRQNLLQAFTNKAYSYTAMNDAALHNDPFFLDNIRLIASILGRDAGEMQAYMENSLVNMALYIVTTAKVLIPLHVDGDGNHISYLIDIPEFTPEHLNLSNMIRLMATKSGTPSVSPFLLWYELQGVYARCLYTATLSYKRTIDEVTQERDELAAKVHNLKLQTTGAPGLSWVS